MTDAYQAVSTGRFPYEPVPDWPAIPADIGFVEAVGVAVDSHDRVFVFARADVPVLMFSVAGEYLGGWGAGQFVRPHGIFIDERDHAYLTDDMGHSVREFTLEGTLIQAIGPSGVPTDSGADGFDHRTIRCGVGPFNLPTNLVAGPGDDLFVTDGYGNARVHRFNRAGQLLSSWGEPGSGPGQFRVPHGIASDGNRLFVCDRENSRVQIFGRNGNLLSILDDVARPAQAAIDADGLLHVFELGFRTGTFPWQARDASRPSSRISIFDPSGKLIARHGGDGAASPSDGFYAAHDLCFDSQGNAYTAEVKSTAAKCVGDDTSHLPSLRKFRRTS